MSENRSSPDKDSDDLTVEELRQWGEQLCWMILAMTPVVWWLQGESVSKDQFVVRVSLLVLSASGGVAFRIAALMRSRRAGQVANSNDDLADNVDAESDSQGAN
tara:strand:- start:3748 stop:4059 length:312 start_codon:yes stop_codon:yes gene_type:complete